MPMARPTQRKPLTAASATAMLMLVAITGTVKSQTPSTQISCTNAFVTLLPCVGYVTGANDTAASACCNGFVSVVVNNAAPCLCQFLGTANPLGVPVSETRALALPAACNISISSLATQCTAIGVPLNPASPAPIASLTPTAPPGGLPATIPGSSFVPPTAAPVPAVNISSSPRPATVPTVNIISPPRPFTADTPNLAPVSTPGDSISGPAAPPTSDDVTNNSPAAGVNNLPATAKSAVTAANRASVVLTRCSSGSLVVGVALTAILL